MSRDSAEPVCPFRAGRFICSPLESNGRGGFKLVEKVGEGLLQSAFPLFPSAAPLVISTLVRQ